MRWFGRGLRACSLLTGGLALLLALVGCPPPGPPPPPIPLGGNLWAEYLVAPAAQPAALAPIADGRVFYTEQLTGNIRVISNGTLLDTPFASVPVNMAGDRGLLGIAASPNFAQDQRIYVFYTRSDTGLVTDDPLATVDNRVVYFVADGDVAAGGEVFVASLPAGPGTTRVSGRLAFAADGTLLVALGDQQAPELAQDNTALVGKILRYNADGTIPADNPIAGSPFYARGVRDVRGLCIDPQSGVAFAVDRNEHGHDEVNRIQAGQNYGWPDVVGVATTPGELDFAANHPDYVDPLYDTGATAAGLVGGSFNPSERYGPKTLLFYFCGAARGGRVITLDLTATRDAVVHVSDFAIGFPSGMTDVAFTPAGTLYVACGGAILRVVPLQ